MIEKPDAKADVLYVARGPNDNVLGASPDFLEVADSGLKAYRIDVYRRVTTLFTGREPPPPTTLPKPGDDKPDPSIFESYPYREGDEPALLRRQA